MSTTKIKKRNPLLDRVALTISPPLRLNIKDIFRKDCHIFSKLKSNFILYPEFDKTGRLHYHGYVWKSEYLANDLELIKESLGFVKTDTVYIDIIEHKILDEVAIKQVNGWDIYCKKEWHITRKILKLKKPINMEYVKAYAKEHVEYRHDFIEWVKKASIDL